MFVPPKGSIDPWNIDRATGSHVTPGDGDLNPWQLQNEPNHCLRNEAQSVLQYSSSLFGSRVFSDVSSALCHDEGPPSSTLHAGKIVIIACDKNTPALGAHEPADAREAGYWAGRLSDFEANRGPWPLLLVTQLAALHDA